MSLSYAGAEVFGKYRLLGIMNSGGMAELFLALQPGLEGFTKVVALKRVLPHLCDSPEFVDMFMDEARIAVRLDHANIVRIYDFGEVQNRYFMSMEYLPGEDLARIFDVCRQKQRPLPIDIAAWIVSNAANGLHFAHEMADPSGRPLGLVHRDANPSNIVVTYYGAVKLVDFGVAKTAQNLSRTQAGMVKGKAAYLAPEQVLGTTIDRRVDVFCLGIVLWEALAGQLLFERAGLGATAHAVVTAPIPPPSQYRPEVPRELDAIALKALAREPAQRYQTAGELQDDIERYFTRRSLSPSVRQVSQWLEQLFGQERAEAKRAIAQGRNLRTSISMVMRTHESTQRTPPAAAVAPPLPPTRGPVEGASTAPRPRGVEARRALSAAVFLVLGGAGLGAAGYATAQRPAPPRSPARTASVRVETAPPGAALFLDGEPTGLLSPTTLTGLIPGRRYTLAVQKAGFRPHRAELTPQGVTPWNATLDALPAQVRIRSVPRNARVLLDGKPVPANVPISSSPGRHVLQIERSGEIIDTRHIELASGLQTITL